ncbi:hypothetical protein A2U01_0037345, partial [Trifolium medium]|nr:hypothetical protein [Trifolium medium]
MMGIVEGYAVVEMVLGVGMVSMVVVGLSMVVVEVTVSKPGGTNGDEKLPAECRSDLAVDSKACWLYSNPSSLLFVAWMDSSGSMVERVVVMSIELSNESTNDGSVLQLSLIKVMQENK